MAKPESSPSRTALRNATLGRKVQFVRRVIEYFPPIYTDVVEEGVVVGVQITGNEDVPVKVMIKQPSVKQRNDLVRRCRRDDGSLDELEFIVQSAIHFVHDPDSGEKLFDQTDYDALMAQPAGDFVDQFGSEAVDLLNLGTPEKNSQTSDTTTTRKQSTP